MDFPNINPIALQFGPIAIRWYSLAYMFGLLGGWLLAKKMADVWKNGVNSDDIDDFLTYATLGVILGGRLGYVIFYNLEYFAMNPLQILKVWQGGMSFHGGFLGVAIAMVLYAKVKKISFLALTDIIVCVSPIGLGLGRVANFINGELFGRVATSDVSWAVIFPNGGPLPRHPSQLYEALLEGVCLFLILNGLAKVKKIRNAKGFLSGLFVINYSIFRLIIEYFREPDAHLGFFFGANVTMGQILSLPMFIAGSAIIAYSIFEKRKNDAK
jgi:phosphatidylglycerol:prolipoprotein diacylglycerol transferase